jgi:hypothetical protein
MNPRTSQSRTVPLALAASVLTLVGFAGLALAQDRKPLPPPPASDEDARTERIERFDAFLGAYRRAGSPRLLIVTDAVPGTRSAQSVDVAEAIAPRLEDLFRDPEVTILSPLGAGLAESRQREALARNDEHAAARMLAGDAGADMVLLVRLSDRPGSSSLGATYTLTDLRQGTTLGRHSFDVLPDPQNSTFDNYRVGEYARAIARRVATQFGEAFPESAGGGAFRRYTLRIVGEYEDDELSLLRDALNRGEGVRQGSVRMRAQEQSSADQLTTLELLANTDTLGVRALLREAAVEELAMTADVLSAKDTTLSVRLSPLGLSARERALAGGPQTSRNRAERELLLAHYERAGKPTIAVMINRATVDAPDRAGSRDAQGQSGVAPVQQGEGVNIIVGDRLDFGQSGILDPIAGDIIREELDDRKRDRLEQGEVDLRQLENRIVERLTNLGLSLKDVSGAQVELQRSAEFGATRWTDASLASALGKQAGADVVLSGVARVVRTRSGGLPLRIEVTMRAYRTSDGVILGASSAQREVTQAGAVLDQAMDDLAAQAAGRLATNLADTWERAVAK